MVRLRGNLLVTGIAFLACRRQFLDKTPEGLCPEMHARTPTGIARHSASDERYFGSKTATIHFV